MTNKIGSKHIAQHRGKAERLEIKRMNNAREAVRQADARARYQNVAKGQIKRQEAASAA